MTEIYQKWGFGMAPPLLGTEAARQKAVAHVLELLGRTVLPVNAPETLEACSLVKGMFNRVLREDQWDWFSVASQLGYPSRMMSKLSGRALEELRTAIKRADEAAFRMARDLVFQLRADACLEVFLGRRQLQLPDDSGWIYVMSSRELRDLLKVGMTRRDVFERAREINSATGVVIPFGIRRCWCVTDPRGAEKLAHEALAEYRMRGDREFFRVDFLTAAALIQDTIRDAGIGIRTLATSAEVDQGLVAST